MSQRKILKYDEMWDRVWRRYLLNQHIRNVGGGRKLIIWGKNNINDTLRLFQGTYAVFIRERGLPFSGELLEAKYLFPEPFSA